LVRVLPHHQLILDVDGCCGELQRATDSSGAGVGGVGGSLSVAEFISPDEHGPESPAAFFGTGLTAAQLRWPIYVIEACGLVYGLDRMAHYVMASDHPVIIRTDHRPLLWLRHASSPMVVRWIVQFIQNFEFVVQYRPGPRHVNADFVSRLPYVVEQISPGVPTNRGKLEALEALLQYKFVPRLTKPSERFLISCLDVAPTLDQVLLSCKYSVRASLVGLPTAKTLVLEWDFALVLPPAERSVPVARVMFSQDRPFAILLPSDLVHLIAGEDLEMQKRVASANTLVFLSSNLVWVIWRPGVAGKEKVAKHNEVVLATRAVPIDDLVVRLTLLNTRGQVEGLKEYEDWAKENDSTCWRRADGSILLRIPGNANDVVVPPEAERESIIKQAHSNCNHGGLKTTLRRLRASHFWLKMATDVQRFVDECVFCSLMNATRSLKAVELSPVFATEPSQYIYCDYAGPFPFVDKYGHNSCLILTDGFFKRVMYWPTRDLTHESFVDGLLTRQVFPRGVPAVLVSDGAGAFRAGMAQLLCLRLGIKHMATAPYSQFQNGMAERRVAFLKRFLTSLTEEEKLMWSTFIPQLEAFLNGTPDAVTGVSPAQLERPWVRPLELFVEPANQSNQMMDPPSGIVADFMTRSRRVVELHRQVMKELGEAEHKRATDQRNDLNRAATRFFSVGDRVAVYMPQKTDKGKHIAKAMTLQWRGPFRVVEQIGANVFRVQHEITKQVTTASPANMVRFKPSTAAALKFFESFPAGEGPSAGMPLMDAMVPDSNVAVWDEDSSGRRYWLAKVLSVDDDYVSVHYYGTLKDVNPCFKLVWVDGSDGAFILKNSTPRGSKISAWTGDEPRERILMVNVNLTASGALSRTAAKALAAIAPAVLRKRSAF